MKLHWKILIWLVAGVVVGGVYQAALDSSSWIGAAFVDSPGGVRVARVADGSPASRAGLRAGLSVTGLLLNRGDPEREQSIAVERASDLHAVIEGADNGSIAWLDVEGRREPVSVEILLDPSCQRSRWLRPFRFCADIFLALLKMLIVPLILTSIVTGVTGVGSGTALRRLTVKTFLYYVTTSLLAIFVGLVLVNVIQPGKGAMLGLRPSDRFEDVASQSFWDVLLRMVPSNLFSALSDNSQMLQVIFFALLFGFFIMRAEEPHQTRMKDFFASAFEVMMQLAQFVLTLIPYGAFCLLAKVVGETGFGLFKPLGLYMLTVLLGLLLHSLLTLPLILKVVGRVSPVRWAKAVGPALMTAFSTSSSSMTLPVTMESVEHRGKVSNRTTSFVLPLGATINMDGTALYECVGVIFLAQYYAGLDGSFTLTLGVQVTVVLMALLASIGAAGIPSAGLVMMLTILGALHLPIEGAALLLAVDRPLDMLRTVTNVWSDSCGAALVARLEGEEPLAGT